MSIPNVYSQIEALCQNAEIIPAKGNLPPVLLSGTQTETASPQYKCFLTYIHLGREVRVSAILLARVYVSLIRIQRVLLASGRSLKSLPRICTALERLVCRTFEFSVSKRALSLPHEADAENRNIPAVHGSAAPDCAGAEIGS